ncbi:MULTISPECIES: AAA family ATPase [unclassified Bradyrhizobium]|uniref:AAA family ATPase n=1 Tax=unclassified Bradyrhizobium TaxID=2631580 RepID=UPI002916EEAD|nr:MULTISPECIES: AAA family ATPase [unclassified Bradyrhizobium]
MTAPLKATPKEIELPKGIQKILPLPNDPLGLLWDSIVLDAEIKDKLTAQAILNFTVRKSVSRNVLPLHGVILLVGSPGTGKTSLARGLAHRVAKVFPGGKFRLIEVEPHQLASSSLGKSQRAVTELFGQAIAEAAAEGPVVVLLDEVETLAVDRVKLSMDANPVDVHRATDAVLVQLDALAERYPNLLFVATSNFPRALDGAFTSRCDLIVEIPLPDKEACARILTDCLTGIGTTYPAVARLVTAHGFAECAAACVGLDGRAIRKMVASALASDPQTAAHPEKVTLAQLLAAAKAARAARLATER